MGSRAETVADGFGQRDSQDFYTIFGGWVFFAAEAEAAMGSGH